MIPGSDHSSFRSEVYAILVAVSAYKHLIIYTDCEAALQGLVYILDCLERDITPTFLDHADLWNIMYNTIKRHQTIVSVIKVKAHSEHRFHSTPFDQWCSQSNAFVDKEAKQSILIDNSDIFQAFHNQHDCLIGNRSALQEILRFQADIATKSFHNRVQTQIQQEQHLATGFVPRGPFITMDCTLSLEECSECKFNQVFLHRLATWAVSLQWDLNTHETTSLFELMLSYIYTTGHYPPFPVRKYPNNINNRAQHWILRDQNPTVDFQGFNCSDLLSGFTRCVNWTKKHLQVSLFPDLPKPDVVALSRYGFKGKTAGIRARALLPHQDSIDNYCNQHMCGKKHFKLPIPWSSHTIPDIFQLWRPHWPSHRDQAGSWGVIRFPFLISMLHFRYLWFCLFRWCFV